jgi:predicted dehydrogenase
MTGATLRFPGGALAQFVSSFGAERWGQYEVIGTEGRVVVHNAFDYAKDMSFEIIRNDGDRQQRTIEKRDQFAPQLMYFARCIRERRDPEPDGWEGYLDVRIVNAIYRSARLGRAIDLAPVEPRDRPSLAQAIRRPGIEKPEEILASAPGR